MEELSSFFSSLNIAFADSRKIKDLGIWLKETVQPDLIFYPQPYEGIYMNELDFNWNSSCLIAYAPYGALNLRETWCYNTPFTYSAWRLYYQAPYNKQIARKLCFNKGLNVRVSGYISSDDFLEEAPDNVWKPQAHRKKRIIWAPHYSGMRHQGWLDRGSFTWLWQFMQELAVKHKESIQIAFKPHPRLLSELYQSPGWGKEKADAYYRWWEQGENTQLETGQFTSLFLSSDAMIHDCNSFMADYLMTGKPVMFTSDTLDNTEAQLDNFGKAALRAHYIGKNVQDVLAFVSLVESDGPDPKASERMSVYKGSLLPANGKTVAENIYEDILSALKFRK